MIIWFIKISEKYNPARLLGPARVLGSKVRKLHQKIKKISVNRMKFSSKIVEQAGSNQCKQNENFSHNIQLGELLS